MKNIFNFKKLFQNPERRRHLRIEIMCPLLIRFKSGEYDGELKNVTKGGIGFKCKQPLNVSDEYFFEFSLPQDRKYLISGVVLWRFEKGKFYTYGIKFSRLSIIQKYFISNFVNNYAKNAMP